MTEEKYDLVIIGAGPAGLSASVYASRYGLKNVVVGEVFGGLVTQTYEIGNWLGEEKISGFDFAQKAIKHVKSLGAEIVASSAESVRRDKEKEFEVFLANGKNLKSKTLLIATGSKHRQLGVIGEKELLGKGVSYCATCDGFFYKDKIVAIVGGSDSAVSASLYMSDIAEKVYLIYRKEKLRAEKFWIDSLNKAKNVEIIYNANIEKIEGSDKVEAIQLDVSDERKKELKVDGVFVEIGFSPDTKLIQGLGVKTDEDGYIEIGPDRMTSVGGVWSAGDITTGSNKFKQIVTAAAEGAIAVGGIRRYLNK